MGLDGKLMVIILHRFLPEAALSAVKLYEQNKDDSLLSFAKKCLSWLDDNLLDKLDGFYYDGLNVNNKTNIDKGN